MVCGAFPRVDEGGGSEGRESDSSRSYGALRRRRGGVRGRRAAAGERRSMDGQEVVGRLKAPALPPSTRRLESAGPRPPPPPSRTPNTLGCRPRNSLTPPEPYAILGRTILLIVVVDAH